jgi:beta-phosphoglucomutase-like phosphatase (HAD superfamily)
MAQVAAVVFDLDGVLVQSEELWDAARRAVAAEDGVDWPNGATEAMMGMSSRRPGRRHARHRDPKSGTPAGRAGTARGPHGAGVDRRADTGDRRRYMW